MASLSLNLGKIIGLCSALGALYIFSLILYNLFFHPLRRFPGPLLMRATRMTYCYKLINGTLTFDMLDLHKKYGDVVRIAPDELAFSDARAWKDIMGHRTHGAAEFEKSNTFYRAVKERPTDIVSSGGQEHALLRRQLAFGFSDRSIREQEPMIMKYVDLLIKRLHENCNDGRNPVDLTAWYNYTTFDAIGDLAFGESFGCLDNSDYHPWIRSIFQLTRLGTLSQTASHFPILKNVLMAALATKAVRERQQEHFEMTKAKLLRRMEVGKAGGRPDLIEGLLKKKDEWNMSIEKLQANSGILIIGGSETTATLLSGVTYFLLCNPEPLKKLTEEVRTTFKSEEEITITSVSKLTYMLACLDEALRMYPPVPFGLPRVVPKGGANICDHFVPEKTTVAIYHWAMYHNDSHFTDPFNYHPERFLGDARFATDNREAFQPFHIGARNCLGRNLAYAEMRLILARVIWNFDLRIADCSRNWLKGQRIYILWEKGPMNVYLTPASRT